MRVDSSEWRDPDDSDEVGQLFVLKSGKLLILKRSDWMAWAPEQWALPGGHIQYGEDIEVGSVRELEEETGLVAESIEHFESYDGIHYFIIDEFEGEIELNGEHTDYAWVSVEELSDFDIVPVVEKRIQLLFTVVR